MNERIKELAEQAKVDAGALFAEMLCNDSEVNEKIAEAWNSQPKEVRTRIFQTIEQNQKKFAELIVRECAEVCKKQSFDYAEHNNKGSAASAADVCRILINQHFGVRE